MQRKGPPGDNPEAIVLETNQEIQVLLAEYQAITDLHKHFDTMNLSIMSILTAGVLVLWGGILENGRDIPPLLLIALATIVFSILCTWLRYASIHRSIVVRKLERACRIENRLGMGQNIIFEYKDEIRDKRRSPGGHGTEIWLYWSLTALGGIVMVVGCSAGRELDFHPGHWRQLGNLALCLISSYVLPTIFFFLHMTTAVWWGAQCRALVAAVIPGFVEPTKGPYRWFLVCLGGYKGSHRDQGRK